MNEMNEQRMKAILQRLETLEAKRDELLRRIPALEAEVLRLTVENKGLKEEREQLLFALWGHDPRNKESPPE